jgi:phosphate transport system substrate-binding protein
MGYETSHVKMLRVVGREGKPAASPTVESVLNRDYPIARTLHLYTLGEPAGALKDYIDWIMSDAGQSIVQQTGYVPLPEQARTSGPAAKDAGARPGPGEGSATL